MFVLSIDRMFSREFGDEAPSKKQLHHLRRDSDTSFEDDEVMLAPDEVLPSKQDQPGQKMGRLDYLRQIWDSIRQTVFVVGSSLVVFIAARNSVTWLVPNNLSK